MYKIKGTQVDTPKEKAKRAELHQAVIDIFIIQSGQEELFIGGRVAPSKKELIEKNEWRAPAQAHKNAKKYIIKKDDIVVIPKNTWHRHGKGSVKMTVIKI